MRDITKNIFGQRMIGAVVKNATVGYPTNADETDTMIKDAQTAYKTIVNLCDNCNRMMIDPGFTKKSMLLEQRRIIVYNIQTLKEIRSDLTRKDTRTKQMDGNLAGVQTQITNHLNKQISEAETFLDQFDKRFGAFVKKNKN